MAGCCRGFGGAEVGVVNAGFVLVQQAHSGVGDADVRGARVAVHGVAASGVPSNAAQARRQAATASPGIWVRSTSPPWSAVSSSRVDANPGRYGQRVRGAQGGGDRRPVAIVRRRAIDPGPHHDAADVTAPVQRRNGHRQAQTLIGLVIQQRHLPVQAVRLAAGPPSRRPTLADPDLQHRAAVSTIERPDHLGPAPEGKKIIHLTIV